MIQFPTAPETLWGRTVSGREMILGIIGLPNSSKTTIFNALTGSDRPVGQQVAGKLESYTAVVDVPDPRVDQLSTLFHPRKTTYAKVSYMDIAGLGKGVGRKGLSGPFRNQIASTDGFVHVVRAFEDATVPHPEGSVDPARDVAIMDTELLLADLVVVETKLERLASELRRAPNKEKLAIQKEIALFERLQATLETETPLRNLTLTFKERRKLRSYAFLTLKPILLLINTGDEERDPADILSYPHAASIVATIKGRVEMEIAQLESEERDEFLREYGIAEAGLDRVIRLSYDLVGLQSFFTVGEDEVRAWTVHRGARAVEAAGVIHTDLSRGFIRAEVASYQQVLAHQGWSAARTAGAIQIEGKEYQVQDGEVLHVRFNV